jgi:hypothetical protein
VEDLNPSASHMARAFRRCVPPELCKTAYAFPVHFFVSVGDTPLFRPDAEDRLKRRVFSDWTARPRNPLPGSANQAHVAQLLVRLAEAVLTYTITGISLEERDGVCQPRVEGNVYSTSVDSPKEALELVCSLAAVAKPSGDASKLFLHYLSGESTISFSHWLPKWCDKKKYRITVP